MLQRGFIAEGAFHGGGACYRGACHRGVCCRGGSTEALFLLMRFVAEGACHIGIYQRGALSNVVRGMNFDSL